MHGVQGKVEMDAYLAPILNTSRLFHAGGLSLYCCLSWSSWLDHGIEKIYDNVLLKGHNLHMNKRGMSLKSNDFSERNHAFIVICLIWICMGVMANVYTTGELFCICKRALSSKFLCSSDKKISVIMICFYNGYWISNMIFFCVLIISGY